MGTLFYGDSSTSITIQDRALAHVKIVVTTKLRRGEAFTLSWTHGCDERPGRSTLWMHPSIPIRFVFDDVTPPELSRSWLEELSRGANSTGGILLVEEDRLDLESVAAPTAPQVTREREEATHR